MNRQNTASELSGMARQALETGNPLDGLLKSKAIKIVNNVIGRVNTRGIFDDAYWRPINKIFAAFGKNDLPYTIEKTRYDKDVNGNPATKRWWVEIPFTNERGREHIIYVHIVASGAGTVDEPLSRYDVVAYAS